MALQDLTRDAVKLAIAEFVRVGRKAFLDRYGFGPARSYFIEEDGALYDSEAIAGVAHQYARPEEGALKFNEFSGGEVTVKPVLQRLGFKVVNKNPRNPPWRRDELILALDFYMRHRERIPDNSSIEIAGLSRELNALGRTLNLAGNSKFRNANGAYMKLMNFRSLDPDYTADGNVGLVRIGKGDAAVWKEFAGQQDRLRPEATRIRGAITVAE